MAEQGLKLKTRGCLCAKGVGTALLGWRRKEGSVKRCWSNTQPEGKADPKESDTTRKLGTRPPRHEARDRWQAQHQRCCNNCKIENPTRTE